MKQRRITFKFDDRSLESIDKLIAQQRMVPLRLFGGVEHLDDLLLPFCACGRLSSQCDGSRKRCPANALRAALNPESNA
jgi:hypothetical protein